MRHTIALIDIIHIFAALTSLSPWLGLALATTTDDHAARFAWVALGILPMIAASISVLVIGLRLILNIDDLNKNRYRWLLFLVLFPPITGTLIWIGYGRPALEEPPIRQKRPTPQPRPQLIQLPPTPPPRTTDTFWEPIPAPQSSRWSNRTQAQMPVFEDEDTARLVARVRPAPLKQTFRP